MIVLRQISFLVLILLFACLASACSIIFPRNSRSLDSTDEAVTLTMMDWCQLARRLRGVDLVQAGINANSVTEALKAGSPEEFAPILAALAAPLIKYGIDYTQTQLQKEADSYTAQFNNTVPEVGFWSSKRNAKLKLKTCAASLYVSLDDTVVNDETSLIQRIVGFEFVRNTKDHKPAFDLIALIVPSVENRVFLIEPIYVVDNSTKAKILARKPWAPWTYLPLIHAGETVKLQIQISISAIWIDKAQAAHTDQIAVFKLPDETVTLGTPKISGFSKGGWFPGVPLTETIGGSGAPAPGANGAFWLGVTVTEQDPSNAQQVVQQAAKAVGDNKDKIQEAILK